MVSFLKNTTASTLEGQQPPSTPRVSDLKVIFSSCLENCNLFKMNFTDCRCHFVTLRPLVSCGSSKNLNNFVHGLDLIHSWEQRCHHVELDDDAGQSKDIDWRVVYSPKE